MAQSNMSDVTIHKNMLLRKACVEACMEFVIIIISI